jgi:hypothetical protein
MASVRSDIATALLARLATVTELKYRAFDEVRLMASDFQDFELPAAQVIDLQETAEHEMRRKKANWQLAIELIVGPNGAATPSQQTLWDLMQTVERAIWASPANLDLPGKVIQVVIGVSSTDLHLMKPFYLGRLEFSVLYYQPLVAEC